MLKLAVTLLHDKSDSENEAQIDTILGLVERITDTHTNPDTGESFDTYHYEIKGLGIPHEVRFYHIVPFGKNRPSNMDQLDGHKVIYGPEFQMGEKTFFNWGLKRGTDHGAEVSIYVEDLSKVDFKALLPQLQDVASKQTTTEFLQRTGCKIANVEYMKKGGLKDG